MPGLPKACQGCAEKIDGRPLATNFSLGRTLGIGGHTLQRMNAQVSLYIQTTGRCLQLAIVFFSCSVRWSTPCQENMVNKKSTIYQTKTVDNNHFAHFHSGRLMGGHLDNTNTICAILDQWKTFDRREWILTTKIFQTRERLERGRLI